MVKLGGTARVDAPEDSVAGVAIDVNGEAAANSCVPTAGVACDWAHGSSETASEPSVAGESVSLRLGM